MTLVMPNPLVFRGNEDLEKALLAIITQANTDISTAVKGDTGSTGAKGDTGTAGAKGDTGATGAAGAKGDTGDKGDTGVGV